MIVLVCGGRGYSDIEYMFRALDRIHERYPIDVLIQGGATGADRMAGNWAKLKQIHVAEVAAMWSQHGKAAGPKRNRAMILLKPDLVVAFPGGSGTADMVLQAKLNGIKVLEL
jgi:hypothetical protein